MVNRVKMTECFNPAKLKLVRQWTNIDISTQVLNLSLEVVSKLTVNRRNARNLNRVFKFRYQF